MPTYPILCDENSIDKNWVDASLLYPFSPKNSIDQDINLVWPNESVFLLYWKTKWKCFIIWTLHSNILCSSHGTGKIGRMHHRQGFRAAEEEDEVAIEKMVVTPNEAVVEGEAEVKVGMEQPLEQAVVVQDQRNPHSQSKTPRIWQMKSGKPHQRVVMY